MENGRKQISNKDFYSLEINIEKNRIYFCILGHWNKNISYETYIADWEEAISYLQPNFTVISDIRSMSPHSVAVEKLHEKAQKYIVEKGLFKVAEVFPVNNITELQASRIAGKTNLPVNKFGSFEEAERYLDQLVAKLD